MLRTVVAYFRAMADGHTEPTETILTTEEMSENVTVTAPGVKRSNTPSLAAALDEPEAEVPVDHARRMAGTDIRKRPHCIRSGRILHAPRRD